MESINFNDETPKKLLDGLISLKSALEASTIGYQPIMIKIGIVIRYFQEITSMLKSIATINVGNTTLKLKHLGAVPQNVFWEAIAEMGHDRNTKEEKAFYRRVALIALCGGIPVDFLDSVQNFRFKSSQFESIGLPICDSSLFDGNIEIQKINEYFILWKEEDGKDIKMSEASLRLLFWDPIFADCFRGIALPWAIRSEIPLETLLNLNCDRRADLGVFITKFKNLILVIEVSEGGFPNNTSHKDYAKINSLLTISCIRLAEELASQGIDPLLARSFGVLVGGPCFQLAVGHPIITKGENGENEIRVDVSTHPHWYCELNSSESSTLVCDAPCCMKADLEPIKRPSGTIPTHQITNENLKQLSLVNLDEEEVQVDTGIETRGNQFTESNLESGRTMEVDQEGEPPDYVAESENYIEPEYQINTSALKKFAIFIRVIKDYIKKLSGLRTVPSKPFPTFMKPNLAYVPVATSGATKDTPAGKQLKNVVISSDTNTNPDKTPSKPSSNGKLTFKEADLYTEKLNAFFCFPKVRDTFKLDRGHVQIEFEELIPLIGDGFYGPHGQLFGPQVRKALTIQLIVEACTFAVHTLYGLHVLHELAGYVHGSISPETAMFSPSDDIWKLTDFGSALPVDKALETVREQRDNNDFVAPESTKTGIFTKSSDVFALGQILWRIFHVQIMWLTCMEEQEEQVEEAYEEFFDSVKLMIKDSPSERPSVISCMKSFNEIIKKNPIRNFRVYGSEKLMLAADKLIERFIENNIVDVDEKEVIPFNEIIVNQM